MLLAQRLSPLVSPLAGVSAQQWYDLVCVLDVQGIQAVSASGGFGSYDLRPRRLVELGYMINLKSTRLNNRWIYTGTFVASLTKSKLLTDPVLQYTILTRSLVEYDRELDRSKITRAGALIILHRGGKGALTEYCNTGKLFSETQKLFDKGKDIF